MNEYIRKWTYIFQKALSDINAKDYEACMQCTTVDIVFTKDEVQQILAILEEASGERKADND